MYQYFEAQKQVSSDVHVVPQEQFFERSVEKVLLFPQERISERISDQTVYVPVPQIGEEQMLRHLCCSSAPQTYDTDATRDHVQTFTDDP